MTCLLPALAALAIGARAPQGPGDDALALFERAGVHVDLAGGRCALGAEVGIRNELLEYLVVAPHGAAHESLFFSDVDPEVLNAALLALGVEPGRNAEWIPRAPKPTVEELRAGIAPYRVEPPEGDGFLPYVGWREGEEVYFYRVEDLVRDLARQRSMQRHRWVFLGSRMVQHQGSQAFAASIEGNLVNIAFFSEGNTLVTAALEACVEQNIWLANAWLLPPRKAPVLLVLARERIAAPDAWIAERLPDVAGSVDPDAAGERR